MIYLFGLVITILAYIIWFVIKPIIIRIGRLIVKIRHRIILLLDLIIRLIILVIVIGGAFFGLSLINNPENIQFLKTIGIDINNTLISESLIFWNGIVLLVGLSFLAIIIARYFFRRPFKTECGFVSDIFEQCQN
jgi:hypothetical protein